MVSLKIADMCKQDTGGQSYKLAKAITKFTPHTSRSFRLRADYLNFPVDIQFGKHNKQFVANYLRAVDVVHVHGLHQWCNGWGPINPDVKWLMHQHGRLGTVRRAQFDLDKQRKALRCVSTLNLLGDVGENASRWIPAPMDLELFDKLKSKFYRDSSERENLLVAHSPTRRDYKGTELLIDIIKRLQKEGLKVGLVLIEGKSHAKCLEKRAACDITFDQMHLCYGNSGLEGMAFGQSTIVGMPAEVRHRVNKIVGYEPFVFATSDTLYSVLKTLLTDDEKRKRCGGRGYQYIQQWHEHQVVAKRVAALYEQLVSVK